MRGCRIKVCNAPFLKKCTSSCICNFFYCNCDPCPNCFDASIEVQQAADEASDGPCADYNEWMFGMTQEERASQLAEQYCIDDDGDDNLDVYEALPNIVQLAESLVDQRVGNQDGSMSCEEFKEAYLEIVPTDLCLHVNSTPYCELDGSCSNATDAETNTTATTSGATGNGRQLLAYVVAAAAVVVAPLLM